MRKSLKDSVANFFCDYLSSIGVSKRTLKNYQSDLSHFTGWFIFQLRSMGFLADELKDVIPFLNKDISHKYKSFMLSNQISPKTINRRLTTLRHLAKFFLESQILDYDFTDELTNYETRTFSYQELVKEFENYLQKDKASPLTIKNYLSDIKQFIHWLETNHKSALTN